MKTRATRIMATVLSIFLVLTVFAACTPGSPGSTTTQQTQTTTTTTQATTEEMVYLEWWINNESGITWEKDGPVSKWLIEQTGVGMYSPLVIWDGGNGYFAKLQTRIATNDLPDIFMPIKGIETSLIEEGLIWNIADYLPQYAPNVWKSIPENVWNVLKANDPTGKGGIYYIPYVTLYNDYGLFIRKDWLDVVGLPVPKTQQEYVDALIAFRDKDPNKNGLADELPTIGREFGRWMDHLFFMYDVALFEGYPVWDMHEGQITYSAVTPNMKKAIEFIRMLYEEKLLDNDTFLNKANNLWEKVQADKVGSWYHIPRDLKKSLAEIVKINPKVEVVVLPRIAADGYEGYISNMQLWGPMSAFGKKDEKTLISALKMLDWFSNSANFETVLFGVEGLHHKVVDGKKVMITDIDVNTTEKKLGGFTGLDQLLLTNQMAYDLETDESIKGILMQTINAIKDSQKDQGKTVPQDGMPPSVYDDYPDIGSHKLYQEYMTKIIIGELPVTAFDEFVTKWNETGGEEVTKRVREWYSKIKP